MGSYAIWLTGPFFNVIKVNAKAKKNQGIQRVYSEKSQLPGLPLPSSRPVILFRCTAFKSMSGFYSSKEYVYVSCWRNPSRVKEKDEEIENMRGKLDEERGDI